MKMKVKRILGMMLVLVNVIGLMACTSQGTGSGKYEDKLDRTDEGFVLVWNE